MADQPQAQQVPQGEPITLTRPDGKSQIEILQKKDGKLTPNPQATPEDWANFSSSLAKMQEQKQVQTLQDARTISNLQDSLAAARGALCGEIPKYEPLAYAIGAGGFSFGLALLVAAVLWKRKTV